MDKLENLISVNFGMFCIGCGIWFGLWALGNGIAEFSDHLEKAIQYIIDRKFCIEIIK